MTTLALLRNSLFKLVFEFIGTLFLTLTFNCTLMKREKILDTWVWASNFSMNQTALLLTLWVLTIFGLKISGAHYNPLISFSFMLRRDVGNFPRPLALAYMLFQCMGAFIGALLSWFLRVDYYESGLIFVTGDESRWVFPAIMAESLGSFIVAFFYLTQTEEKTLFSKEKAINCFIIASSYIGARAMLNGTTFTPSGAVLNPAIAFGTSLTQLFVDANRFKWVWIYTLFPFAGAVLAVLFYEFVFKKTQEALNEDGDEDDDNNDTLLDR